MGTQNCIENLARAWNNLDASLLEPSLDEHIEYISHWVLKPLQGKEEVLSFLRHKFETIKCVQNHMIMHVQAELASHPALLNNNPCIVLTQISNEEINEVIVIADCFQDKIIRIIICIVPGPSGASLYGIIPK